MHKEVRTLHAPYTHYMTLWSHLLDRRPIQTHAPGTRQIVRQPLDAQQSRRGASTTITTAAVTATATAGHPTDLLLYKAFEHAHRHRGLIRNGYTSEVQVADPRWCGDARCDRMSSPVTATATAAVVTARRLSEDTSASVRRHPCPYRRNGVRTMAQLERGQPAQDLRWWLVLSVVMVAMVVAMVMMMVVIVLVVSVGW